MTRLPPSAPESAHEPKAYSFDIFDTVLTRAVSPPNTVFLLTAQRVRDLLPAHCTIDQFVFLREQADERAQYWHGNDKTIADIYRELQTSLHVPAHRAARIMHAEMAIEKEVLYAVPETRSRIQAIRERGRPIAFTSDMYLPSEHLKECLDEHGLWEPGDQLFVSCEHGMQKSGGYLFGPVTQSMGVPPENMVHIGNCAYADVKGARQANMTAVHFTAGNTNRYENILANHILQTGGLSGLMAGASRYARLHTPVETSHDKALRDVAAGVMAPILSGFILWLLHQVDKQGIKRLYFTSRDGHALLPIVQRLAQVLQVDCEFKYLHFSRAVITAANPRLDALYRTLEYETAGGEDILARFNLELSDLAEHLSTEDDLEQVISRPITDRGKQLIAEIVSKENGGGSLFQTVEDRQRLLRDYLIQEGFHENGQFGFVDIGWKGTNHGLLNDLLLEEDIIDEPLPGFFFGLTTPQQLYASDRTAYFFDEYRKTGFRGILEPGSAIFTILETFCTANHGTVTDYQRTSTGVRPIFEPTWGNRMESWGLPVVRRTVDAFLDGLTRHEALLSARVDARAAFVDLLRAFWHEPTPEQAEAWGTFPRESGQGDEQDTEPLAEPYGWTALPHFALQGQRAHRDLRPQFSWPQGAFARSPARVRRAIQRTLRGRRFAKKVVRKITNLI